MPASTPHGYPYPLGTDRVMDGDDAIHNLATAVDTQLGAAAQGTVSCPITAVSTPVSVSITFPSGRFNAVPAVTLGAGGTNPDFFRVSVSNVTATGCILWGYRATGSAAFPISWIALLV